MRGFVTKKKMEPNHIENALNNELQRMEELHLSAIDKTQFIRILTKKVLSLPSVKKFDYDFTNNSPTIVYKNKNDWPIKFSFNIAGPHGFGAYPKTEIAFGNKTILSDIFVGFPFAFNFKSKFFKPKGTELDFSAFFNPGFQFSLEASKFKVKHQTVRKDKYAIELLTKAATFKLFYRHMRKPGDLAKATPDMCVFPPYHVFGTKIHFMKGSMENICSAGVLTSKHSVQPFYWQQSYFKLKLNDILSSNLTSGFIFSKGTLPVLERFYRISPYVTSSVLDNGIGISNGNFIAACDCYATADLLAQFDSGPWEITCFTKGIIAGLSKPDLPLEQAGVLLYSFVGFSIDTVIFNRTPSLTIYYPIYSPEYIKTIPFRISIN